MDKDELITYVRETFSAEPDYPFEEEDVFVFRHVSNRKWFAIVMRIPYRRLGIEKEELADVIDVKCGPLLMDVYRKQQGVFPGYHMNKDNWVTILLDGTAESEVIKELLEISFELTKPKRKHDTSRRL